MKKDKKLKKLSLSLETLRRLEGVVGGAAAASAPQCSMDSCVDTCDCPPAQTGLQCTLHCDAQ